MHLRAIDTVLNASGSMLPILQEMSHDFYPSIIACQYACVDLHVKELEALERVKNRFFRSLQLVSEWHELKIANKAIEPPRASLSLLSHQSIRNTLEEYLDFLVRQLHEAPDDCIQASTTIILVQWLCLTLVYLDQSNVDHTAYLALLNDYLEKSSQKSPRSGRLLMHPTQVIGLICYTSNFHLGQNSGVEPLDFQSRICADCVDGSKIVPYLSRDARHRVLAGLLSVAQGEDSVLAVSEDDLAEMSAEIATSWWRRNKQLEKEAGLAMQ
jgi:hypothetical protein